MIDLLHLQIDPLLELPSLENYILLVYLMQLILHTDYFDLLLFLQLYFGMIDLPQHYMILMQFHLLFDQHYQKICLLLFLLFPEPLYYQMLLNYLLQLHFHLDLHILLHNLQLNHILIVIHNQHDNPWLIHNYLVLFRYLDSLQLLNQLLQIEYLDLLYHYIYQLQQTLILVQSFQPVDLQLLHLFFVKSSLIKNLKLLNIDLDYYDLLENLLLLLHLIDQQNLPPNQVQLLSLLDLFFLPHYLMLLPHLIGLFFLIHYLLLLFFYPDQSLLLMIQFRLHYQIDQ